MQKYNYISYVKVVFLFLAFLYYKSHAQKEKSIWYFGQKAGMKYNGSTYQSISDNSIGRNIFLGIIEGPDNIICANDDDDGNLLFYSDGRTYRNRLHQNLINSPTEEYAFRQSQAAIARDPGNPNRYYVFITIMDGLKNRLTYTIVDISLNNGFGGLVEDKKHVLIVNDTTQHMVIARHANGVDSWLITIRNGRYHAYLITENGISFTPVTSQAGFSVFNGTTLDYGNLVISSDNKLLVAGFPLFKEEENAIDPDAPAFTSKILLSRFNDLNGTVELIFEDSSPTEATGAPPYTGIEFSSNNQVLYTSYVNQSIQQYDISDPNNIPEPFIIASGSQFPYLKRGPDGQIFSIQRGQNFIGAIQEPNTIGLGCNFNPNVLSLSAENLLDLPVFLLPKYPEGISFKNICEGEETEFNYNTSLFRVSYEWDLGDGNTASEANFTHIYENPGTYTVTVNIFEEFTNNLLFTSTNDITVYESPIITTPDDLYLCTEDTTIFFADFNDQLLDDFDPNIFSVSYYFSENDAQLKNDAQIEYIPEIGSKTIWIRVENRLSPSCYDIVSFDIVTPEYVTIDMPTQQYICDSRSGLTLTAPDGFISYNWSNGEISQSIDVDSPGLYTLTVVKDFGNFTCEAKTTITVSDGNELPVIEDLKVIDWSRNHNSIEVILDRVGRYEYSVDGVNFQESNIFLNLPFKDYKVYVRDIDCQQTIESEELFLLYHDHFFTPNGDGRHDYWRVINNFKEEDIEILIFNRYGKLLETMNYYDRGWDGTFNGVPMPTDDYWFRVVRQNGKVYHGHFTLKR